MTKEQLENEVAELYGRLYVKDSASVFQRAIVDLAERYAAEKDHIADASKKVGDGFNFKCPKCGSPYFGTVNPLEDDHSKRLVECHGDSSGGPRRCDYVGPYSDHIRDAGKKVGGDTDKNGGSGPKE